MADQKCGSKIISRKLHYSKALSKWAIFTSVRFGTLKLITKELQFSARPFTVWEKFVFNRISCDLDVFSLSASQLSRLIGILVHLLLTPCVSFTIALRRTVGTFLFIFL